MEDLIKDIHNIISESNNQIHDKILGVNYLEKLKYHLIDKLKTFKITSIKDVENLQNKEIRITHSQNNLLIKFENNSNPLSKIKNTIQNDYLCIVLNGSKSIKIHENLHSTQSQSINLFSNTGIVLSKATVISESISKQTILINIFYIKNDIDIEN